MKLRTEHLWPLVILAALGFYTSLVPLPPNDFWWHLKIGELIATRRAIPTTNMFAWTLPADAPFTYGAWLGELLLYVLYRWGGLELVTFARNVLVLAAFWLAARAAWERCGSWRLVAPALALAAGMSLNNLVIRPQIWSFPLFALYLWLLTRHSLGRLRAGGLLVLPPLMAFWVNAHGAFVLGLVLVGIFVVDEALQALLREPGARAWRDVGALAGAAALTALATLANPRGIGIAAYVVDLLTDRPSQALVVEWQSPTPSGIANVVFYVSILVLLLTLAWARRRPLPADMLLMTGFLWLAWSGMRYVIWYGFVMMPVLAGGLKALWPRLATIPSRRSVVNLLLAVLLFVPVLIVQPWWVERVPLPERYWKLVWRGIPQGPLVGRETPVAAVEYLRAHPGGHLFNEMGYGSYLIWALPEQKVFIDPRVELYPYEQWRDYIRIGQGVRYNELLERYGADRLMVDRELQGELIRALEDDPRWEQEYADERTEIWRRVR
ncbi:MAG: hypothetical protein ACUVR6_10410 [Anaerolineae bacterium]